MKPSKHDYLNWFKCHSMFHHMAAWSCFSARVSVLIVTKWSKSEIGEDMKKIHCSFWIMLLKHFSRFNIHRLIYAISIQIKLHNLHFPIVNFYLFRLPNNSWWRAEQYCNMNNRWNSGREPKLMHKVELHFEITSRNWVFSFDDKTLLMVHLLGVGSCTLRFYLKYLQN